MSASSLQCKTDKRRHAVRASGADDGKFFNGLDFLEVTSTDQKNLTVYLIRKASDKLIELFNRDDIAAHVLIEGGRRITDIKVTEVNLQHFEDASKDDYLLIEVDEAGDFSNYVLRLAELENGVPTDRPLPGFDPRYASLTFSFKSDCPSDLDCKPRPTCPPRLFSEPDINYLAKDYGSFRQLILDRLAQTMPEWRERAVPDLGIALVELMAYVGDRLSYHQDAVATETYLDTARRRVSVRRHARLVDYQMHEGCNARAWVHLQLSGAEQLSLDPRDFFFITSYEDAPEAGRVLDDRDLDAVPRSQYEVFEPLAVGPGPNSQIVAATTVYQSHNRIQIYTWGDSECCLPRGATSASLLDEWEAQDAQSETAGEQPPERKLKLQPGDFLLFEEIRGPSAGDEDDANPEHRHVVRLTEVEQTVDELNNEPVLEVQWAQPDALPFPLCVSSIGPPPKCELLENLSVARGNILVADHGRQVSEDLGRIGKQETDVTCLREDRPSDSVVIPERFRPQLSAGPLTFSAAPPDASQPASKLLQQDVRQAVPQIKLMSRNVSALRDEQLEWRARSDLLHSDSESRHFVVEMDEMRLAHLRFGDGELGRMPQAGAQFDAHYRIGNGPRGNVGADRIRHVVFRNERQSKPILEARNPLPAQGGRQPEPKSEAKLFAPTAFLKRLERAITTDDYAEIAGRHEKVQRAAATFRWTGSWYEVLVAIDPFGGVESAETLVRDIERHLFRFRRMGHDLRVELAEFVPLDIEMEICVLPSFLRGHVKAELQQVLGNGTLPDGRLGFFHPDRLTFNQPIRLSRLIAAAQAVPGVESVKVNKLERLFEGPNNELERGILNIASLEIARLDNDPNFPENGRLELKMRGGR